MPTRALHPLPSPRARAKNRKSPGSPALERFVLEVLGASPPLLFEQRPASAQTVPASGLNWSPAVARGFGYAQVYTHQAEAYRALEHGHNVVLTTPTASGKTGAFFPALFAALERDPQATALLVYPLVALAQDQRQKLLEFDRRGGFGYPIAAFEGGTEARATFASHPRIVTTTPDKLHWSLGLPALRSFLERLSFVVLDEAHTYRGGFGAEVSGLLRRLFALCSSLRPEAGSAPRVVLSTATLGEPLEFARTLSGLSDFVEVSRSGAAVHRKRFLRADHGGQPRRFWDALVRSSVEHRLKTLVFVRGRGKATRLHQEYAAGGYADQVYLYLSGGGAREATLGRFRAAQGGVMFATSALEAGVDIGDLDTVLLDGYPGNRMTFRQMVGRCGRAGEGLVLFLPAMDADGEPLPSDAFYSETGPFQGLLVGALERLPLEADNPLIAPKHAALLAFEHRRQELTAPDPRPLFGVDAPARFERSSLRGMEQGKVYVLERRRFEAEGVGPGRGLETPSEHYARLEKHLAARVVQGGHTFEVREWRPVGRDTAVLFEPADFDPEEFTRGFCEVQLRPLEMTRWERRGPLALRVGRGALSRRYPGYGLYRRQSVRICKSCDLEPPPGVWLEQCPHCGGRIQDRLRTVTVQQYAFEQAHQTPAFVTGVLELGIDPESGAGPAVLSTLRQSLLKLIPERIVCDPADLGVAARAGRDNYLFVFEDVRGGLGVVGAVYQALPELLSRILELCEQGCCARGCYRCVARSSRAEGLDKAGTARLLRQAGLGTPVGVRSDRS